MPVPVLGRPFMILGMPRSGTNFLSALIKAHPAVELQIEPFSLHTRSFLSEDLEEEGRAARVLSGFVEHDFLADLRSWLIDGEGRRGFKETTLFAKLPLVAKWLPGVRVIYISRDECEVVRSYLSRNLVVRWRLAERYKRHSDPEVSRCAKQAQLDPRAGADLIAIQFGLRNAYWERHRHVFERLEVRYQDLATAPRCVLKDVMQFLGFDLSPFQETAIQRRHSITGRSTYSTFRGANVARTVPLTPFRPRHEPVKSSDGMSLYPVTVQEAAKFLNACVEHGGNSIDEYQYFNPFNSDLKIRYDGTQWTFRPEDANLPATGFSILGAQCCCQYLGGRLPSANEMWAFAERLGWPDPASFPEAANAYGICDTADGPTPTGEEGRRSIGLADESGDTVARSFFGNVAEWCLPLGVEVAGEDWASRSFPVFGAGWNKDDSYLQRRTYCRWGRSGSVSVGFRMVV